MPSPGLLPAEAPQGPTLRRGIRLGLDVGARRIGVARSDPDGMLAVPVTTIVREPGDRLPTGGASLDAVAALVREWEPLEIIVGLPLTMSGDEGPAAVTIRGYAQSLAARVAPCPVVLLDERLSTVSAQRDLHASGRTTRTSRSVIDAAAAVIIVTHALDSERASGRPPGTPVTAAPRSPANGSPANGSSANGIPATGQEEEQ